MFWQVLLKGLLKSIIALYIMKLLNISLLSAFLKNVLSFFAINYYSFVK